MNWKRGALHALIPFGLVVAGGIAVVATKRVADPHAFGEGIGRFAAVAALIGLAISYLAQTGKKKAAWGVAVGVVAVVAAVAVAVVTAGKPAIDRRPLVDDGATLRHPSLHFSIKRPPAAFHESPELVKAMGEQDPDTVIYAYGPTPPSAGLVIAVMWGVRDLAEAMQGVKRGVDASSRGTATWDQMDLGSEDAHLHAVMSGVHLRIDGHRLDGAVVTVMTMANDPDALGDVISSFQR